LQLAAIAEITACLGRAAHLGPARQVAAARPAGHAVHVVDPVPEHVAAASALPGVTEVAEAGLELDRIAAVEGPLWTMARLPEILADEQRTARALATMRELEGVRELWGAGSHLLTAARRPA
jgi:hypothetical protein